MMKCLDYPNMEFIEGDEVIAFDADEWMKVGKDIGDNSCFYENAIILNIYYNSPSKYGSGGWCATVKFNNGKISKGHFLNCLKSVK